MTLPTSSDVHVDAALTNISVAFIQDASHFVAGQVFPTVPVSKQSDKYFTINRGDFNRDEAQVRAPGTETAGGGYRLDNTPSYFCDVHGFHQDIPDQVAANADAALDLEWQATMYVTTKLLIQREVNWAATYFAGGLWDNDYDGVSATPGTNETTQWSDTTSGDPIGDIRAARTTVLGNTGFEPNTLVVGQEVYDAIVDHPDIVDRVKYSGGVGNGNPAMVNGQTLAALFDLDRVLVSKSIKNTAAEGATETSAFIGGKKALLVYTPRVPGLMTPAAGYTFTWRNYLSAANDQGIAISRFDGESMQLKRSIRIEGECAYDQKLVSAELGYFWDTIVA